MKYAATFFLLGVCWVVVALVNGGWFWLLLWPAVSFLVLAWAYLTARPALLGKRDGGGIHAAALVLLLPYFLLTWVTWHVVRLGLRSGAGHEVAPGVYVGRRPYLRELPPDTRLVIDMTGEFIPARGIRLAAGEERSYLCVPTLDGSAPPDAAWEKISQAIGALPAGGGSVYIHCAQGRGRSAAVAAAVLIARGLAKDVEEAERLMCEARPVVRLNAAQRAWARRVTALPKREAGPAHERGPA